MSEVVLTVDVVVAGAGPAGSAAALTLARGGRDVLLLDKARFPREKCCGDGLTTAALRHLEDLGLDPHAVASWQVVEDVCVRSPSGRTVELALPRGRGLYAAVARRSDLDAALVGLARGHGVRVHDGHRLVGARQEDGAISVDVEGLGPV
ncbi:MAG TPA: FAD-dependent monooxygenase, partial [Acidimicrobiales bacterium]|nr:FAD-dependent monooxygenase [Acidimicrobiales bacterium]